MYFSGIDLHKDMSFISSISLSGQILKQSKLPNTEYAIQNYFSQFDGQHKAVVESTSNWCDTSEPAGQNSVVCIFYDCCEYFNKLCRFIRHR